MANSSLLKWNHKSYSRESNAKNLFLFLAGARENSIFLIDFLEDGLK